jgi:hypothetical protein
MESVVRDRLIDHLNVNNLLSDCQHGFIAGRSCTTNLLSTLNEWTRLLDEREPVDAVYLDFAKAFDSVPHERLLRKLKSLGIESNVLKWIKDFLVGRRQRVSINGTVSDWASVRSGVPQGSVLGPVLFIAFINDLPEAVSSVCSMYADDTKVYNTVRNTSQQLQLQDDLDSLVDWADKWQLRFNADKCKVIHLGKNNEQQDYSMRRHGCNDRVMMSKSTMEKDLGVNVDNELKFSKHIEAQVNKANKRLGLIRRSYEYIDAEAMKLLFVAVVRPNLEFGNAVWSPKLEKDKNLVESVQRRATRIIPGLKGKPYEERLKIMKLPSLRYRRLRGDLIEVYKYTHGLYKVPEGLLEFETRTNTRGHGYKLKKLRCNTSMRQHFFSLRVTDMWNSLPDSIVDAPSVNAFKNRLDEAMQDHMFSLEMPSTLRTRQ